jgi:ferredoxin
MIVVTAACRGCGACLLTCPERAIRPAERAAGGAGPLAVLALRCTGCGECIEVCPADAISLTSDLDFGEPRAESRGGQRDEW